MCRIFDKNVGAALSASHQRHASPFPAKCRRGQNQRSGDSLRRAVEKRVPRFTWRRFCATSLTEHRPVWRGRGEGPREDLFLDANAGSSRRRLFPSRLFPGTSLPTASPNSSHECSLLPRLVRDSDARGGVLFRHPARAGLSRFFAVPRAYLLLALGGLYSTFSI